MSCHITGCFRSFDKDGDNLLNLQEFRLLCNALFRNDKIVYQLGDKQLQEMFNIFDKNEDGFIDIDEFKYCWYNWFKYIIHPRSVLLVIDIQNDFVSGNFPLHTCEAKQNAADVIRPINTILSSVEFLEVVYTQDWHPSNHISFVDNVSLREIHPTSNVKAEKVKALDKVVFAMPDPLEVTVMPRHCVEKTWGAELHKDLKIVENSTKIYKGTHPDIESLSVFKESDQPYQSLLHNHLSQRKVTDIYIAGLCFDVSVWYTAIDALSMNYRVIIIEDCCRGLNLKNIESAKADIIAKNGVVVHSSQVKNIVEGKDRRTELGYQLAVKLKHDLQNTEIQE